LKKSKVTKRHDLTWDYFSLWIRHRDNHTCVLCGNSLEDGFIIQAGHVIPRGVSRITYDERNVYGQCAICNQTHKYYPQYYFKWFIAHYGQELFNDFSDKEKNNAIVKRGVGYYRDIADKYKELLETAELTEYEKVKVTSLEKRYNKLYD